MARRKSNRKTRQDKDHEESATSSKSSENGKREEKPRESTAEDKQQTRVLNIHQLQILQKREERLKNEKSNKNKNEKSAPTQTIEKEVLTRSPKKSKSDVAPAQNRPARSPTKFKRVESQSTPNKSKLNESPAISQRKRRSLPSLDVTKLEGDKTKSKFDESPSVEKSCKTSNLNIHQLKILEKRSANQRIATKQSKDNNLCAKSETKKSPNKAAVPSTSKTAKSALEKTSGTKNDSVIKNAIVKAKKRTSRINSGGSKNIAAKRIEALRDQLSQSLRESVPSAADVDISDDIRPESRKRRMTVGPVIQPNTVQLTKTVSDDLDVFCTKKKILEVPSIVSIQDAGYGIINASIQSSTEIVNDVSMDEEMDWETAVEEVIQAREDLQIKNALTSTIKLNQSAANISASYGNTFIVVDTNIFISNLKIVQEMTSGKLADGIEGFCFIVPWRVLCELDGLKSNPNNRIQFMARKAMNFLHENLPANPKIKGQTLKDAHDHLFCCQVPDDEILNCCLQLSGRGEKVALLTNDVNLCNKAIVNKIQTYTHKQFEQNVAGCNKRSVNKDVPEIQNGVELLARKSIINNENEGATAEEDLQTFRDYQKLEKSFCELMANVLETEMRCEYGKLWLQIVMIPPPWSLADVITCILKHWMAVFGDVFTRSMKSTMTDLQKYFPKKSKDQISQEELHKLASLVLQVVQRCETLPKYASATNNCLTHVENILNCSNITEMAANNIVIIDTIQNIFKGLSIFCIKIANFLNVPHNLIIAVDMTESSLQELISQADSVGNQILQITQSTERVLTICSINAVSSCGDILDKSGAAKALNTILHDTLIGMGLQGSLFDEKQFIYFILSCRDVVEESHKNFTSLYKLLENCSMKYSTLTLLQ